MKILKGVAAILGAILVSFLTRHYMSNINYEMFREFAPIPHFFSTVESSYKYSLYIFLFVYGIVFLYFFLGKYVNFAVSLIGIMISLGAYKKVIFNMIGNEVSFITALIVLGKYVCVSLAAGIVLQWAFDIMVSYLRLVRKSNRKKKINATKTVK